MGAFDSLPTDMETKGKCNLHVIKVESDVGMSNKIAEALLLLPLQSLTPL